jgi:hypothetical protein
MDDYFWASANDNQPAGDRFIIAEGREEFRRRAPLEVGPEPYSWDAIRGVPRGAPIAIEDILAHLLTCVQHYGVNHNRAVMEFARIPVFAKFLHESCDLHQIVSNPMQRIPITREPYSADTAKALARRIAQTLEHEELQ